MDHYSLNELSTQIEKEDVLLECSIVVHADISIERQHSYIKDDKGSLKLILENGWLVSLTLPAKATLAPGTPPFSDGEQQVVCDMLYQSGESHAVSFEDALRALGIHKDAKIWRVRQAP